MPQNLRNVVDVILRFVFSRIVTRGNLTIHTARGTRLVFGDGTGSPVTVRLTDTRAEWLLLLDPDMRLGELFMDSRFIVEQGTIYDFVYLILREAKNRHHPFFARALDQIRIWCRRFRWQNLPTRSKRNVAHHYDLDTRLYRLFLDEDLQYSCAFFETPDQSLEEAQQTKKRRILAKLLLGRGQSVLDIGCGWGGLARTIAHSGAGSVLGVTLSEEQLAYARKARSQTDDNLDFQLLDYRQVVGQFDRIVSVGMFEHVGRSSYRDFFRTCRDLLTDDGVMVLHTIGCLAKPGFTTPWLDKYIFPGGYIPSLSEIVPEIERASLLITDIEVLRLHYARTLQAWRSRFMSHWDEASALYDDRFCRMWEYYLSAAEVAFRCEDLVVFQIQMSKQLETVPITRNYLGHPDPMDGKPSAEIRPLNANVG